MFRFFGFKCNECSEELENVLVKDDEIPLCCDKPMEKLLGPTKGFVKGSENPVKQ